MKKSWNLPLDEEELGNHFRMKKSLVLIPGEGKPELAWNSTVVDEEKPRTHLWMKKRLNSE
jgi:hypothetical protein